MKVGCIAGHWHDVSPTGLALILDAFMAGELQTVGPRGVQPLCFLTAFTPERMEEFKHRYQGNRIPYLRAVTTEVPPLPIELEDAV